VAADQVHQVVVLVVGGGRAVGTSDSGKGSQHGGVEVGGAFLVPVLVGVEVVVVRFHLVYRPETQEADGTQLAVDVGVPPLQMTPVISVRVAPSVAAVVDVLAAERAPVDRIGDDRLTKIVCLVALDQVSPEVALRPERHRQRVSRDAQLAPEQPDRKFLLFDELSSCPPPSFGRGLVLQFVVGGQ